MSNPVSKAMPIGLTVMLLSVSAGIYFNDVSRFGLLLSFTGVLAGANLVTMSAARMTDGAAPIVPVVCSGARALAEFVRLNAAAVGLVLASCALTVVSGEPDPVLCFAMFVLFLIGISLVNFGARGDS